MSIAARYRFAVALALTVFAVAAAARFLPRPAAPVTAMGEMPTLVLWAWERSEHLEFIDSRTIAVAYLAGTYSLHNQQATWTPRRQPLYLPAATETIAVVRIEADADAAQTLSPPMIAQMAQQLSAIAQQRNARALQIDFDASKSERGFYKKLLAATHRSLPASMPLSITALASWCSSDTWISGLPIDEAVPMLFRMGVESGEGRRLLDQLADAREPLCRGSVGVSMSEVRPRLTAQKRTYVFSEKLWNQSAVAQIEKEIQP